MSQHTSYSMHKFLENHDVLLAYLGSITILAVERYLGVIALILTVGYTIFKWTLDIYDRWFNKKTKRKKYG